MLEIKKNTIDDYLGWNKLLVGVNSSAIIAIFFKSTTNYEYHYAAYSFIVSLIFTLLFSLALIEHKNSTNDTLNNKYSFLYVISWSTFLLAFILLII